MKFRVFLILSFFFSFPGCTGKRPANARANDDGSGYVLFRDGSKFGYRDETGSVVINPQYVEAGNFSWGLARVRPDPQHGWGYIDASGTIVLQPRYEAAGDFADGIAVVLNNGALEYLGPDGASMGLFEEDEPARAPRAGDTLYVIHPKGLVERSSANVASAPVARIPPEGVVIFASGSQAERSETDDGLHGTWIAVRYKGKVGFLFDLYLSHFPMNMDHLPTEHYQVVGSSINNDLYSVYTLTKFTTRGRMIVHQGPNWTDTREIVPDATVDQVIARLKLYPSGDLGNILQTFHGLSGRTITEQGDTVVASITRNNKGFLRKVTWTQHGEESVFDATIADAAPGTVEITTTTTVPPSEADN